MAELTKQIVKSDATDLDPEVVLSRFGYCWVTEQVAVDGDPHTTRAVKKPGVFVEYLVDGEARTLQRSITLAQFQNLTGAQLKTAALNHVLAEVGLG